MVNLEFKLPCKGRPAAYYTLMMQIYGSMLVYAALEENGIEMQTLLQYAAMSGISAVCKVGSEYRCGALHWASPQDDNGIADRCTIHGRTWAAEFATDDIAYFRNNWLQQPERLDWFARMFAECDDAQKCLIRNTKCVPVPVAATKTEQKEYENVLRAIQSGCDTVVMLRPASNDVMQDTAQKETDRVLTISDPTMIEKMHYLSEYHAELKKRFASLYGMCFRSSSKSAQATVDEVHGMDNFSLLIPYNKRAELELFADKCSRLWGWAGSETVDFSELWKRENESAEIASAGGEPMTEQQEEGANDGGENTADQQL